jgi:hypothetical protein
VWILDFVRELKRSKAARDKATRERKRAEFELERHQATLIALWGNRYRKHPELFIFLLKALPNDQEW